jgi:class 3 adenylate cyclase/tetratricopeptide (TPR) repeat protein
VSTVKCPACAAENASRQKFCGECGSPLRPAEPQRRELTILFCDIVDSMSLSQKLDPEELRSVMTEYRRVASDIVARFEGHIAQWLGDGILSYFGYPKAHEDDALRSVLCGLELIEAVKRLDATLFRDPAFRLQVRVGIHSGPVVIGSVGGAGRQEHLAEGETPNIAARIQAEAEPNTAVVSESVAKLLPSRVELFELGPRSLKGATRRLSLHRVVGETRGTVRADEAALAASTQYTGRAQEISVLGERWSRAKDGEPQAVSIVGSAGIGKSRLVDVFRQRLEPNAVVLRCQCSALHRSTPFHPVLALIRERLAFGPNDSVAERVAKLEAELASIGHANQDGTSLLAPLFSLPAPNEELASTTSAQRRKILTLEVLRDWFLARARGVPTVCVVEDLHWADPSTTELVHLIFDSLEGSGPATVLLLLTHRPEQFTPPWSSSGGPVTISLHPLPPDETALMANRVVGGVLPPEALREVIRRTEGVPLFVEELLRFFVESGVLQASGKAYQLVRPPPGDQLPSTLNALLAARLDRLEPRPKEVAQLGATIGREFNYALIRAISSLDDAALREALDDLESAKLVERRGTLPDAQFAFRHALIQEAAYDTLLRVKRQDYHRRIATVLEDRFPELELTQPELLARHYGGAMLTERATFYWQKAAEQALARANNVEAITHLSKALQLTTSLEESESRDLAEFRMRLALAPAQMAIMGWPSQEVEVTCLRALDLSAKLLAGNVGENATEVQVGSAASLWLVWTVYFLRGHMKEALARAEQVLDLAMQSGNRAFEVMGHHAVGFTQYYVGNFPVAEEHARRGIAKFDVEAERFIVRYFQFSSTVCLQSFYASVLVNRGYPGEAHKRVQAALDLVEHQLGGHRPSRAYAEAFGAYRWMFQRDFRLLAESSKLLRLLSQQEGFLFWLPFADAFDGILLSQVPGKLDEGIDLLRHGIDGMHASGGVLTAVELHPWLAASLVTAGREEEAIAILDTVIADVNERGEMIGAPEHHRVRAEALGSLAEKRHSPSLLRDALQSNDNALQVARAQGATLLELRAAVTRVRLFARPIDDDSEKARSALETEAKALLRKVYDTFTEGFDSPDMREAAALLS